MRQRIWALIAGCLLAGCNLAGPHFGGTITGSAAIPGESAKLYEYVFQFDEYQGSVGEAKRKPLFAVCWLRANDKTATSSSDFRNLITAVNGHPISPSLTKKAVYALQPDYRLDEIRMTNDEIDHVFEILQSHEGSPTQDRVWRAKIVPQLKLVD